MNVCRRKLVSICASCGAGAALLWGLTGCGDSSPHSSSAVPATETTGTSVASSTTEGTSTERPMAAKPPANPEADILFATLTAPESPDDWERAQSRLVELGEAAVPTLSRELQSDDPFHRDVAASALAMLGPAAAGAETELRGALRDDSVHVRANAATALCAMPEQADVVIPVLTELLMNDDPQVRQMSAINLSSFAEEAAPHVAQLAAMLKSAPSDVLVPVVELLGRIGPEAESAAPQLQQIAFEQDGDAKQAATAALERINARTE